MTDGLLTKRFGRTVAAAFGLALLVATTTVELYSAVNASSECGIVGPANMPSCSTTCYRLNYSATALWTLANQTTVNYVGVNTPDRNTTGYVDLLQDVCVYGDGFRVGGNGEAIVTAKTETTYDASMAMFSAVVAPLNNITFYFPALATATGTLNISLYDDYVDHSVAQDALLSCNASQSVEVNDCEPEQWQGWSAYLHTYSVTFSNGTTDTHLNVMLVDYWVARVATVINTTIVPTCSIPTAGVTFESVARFCSPLNNAGIVTASTLLPFLVSAAAIKGIDALLQAFANEGSSLLPLSANTAVGWRIGSANKIMHLAAFIFVCIAYGATLATLGAQLQTGPLAVIGFNIAAEAVALVWVFGLRGLFYRHAHAIQAWLHRTYPRLVGAPEAGLTDKMVVSS